MCSFAIVAFWIVGCSQRTNHEYVDLNEYLKVADVNGNAGISLVVDGDVKGLGFSLNGTYYLPYEIVRESLDNNYYYDSVEGILTYASAKHIYDTAVDSVEYTKDGEKKGVEQKTVILVDKKPYISYEYVKLMNGGVGGTVYQEPARITFVTGDKINVVTASQNGKLRSGINKTDNIVKDIKKGDKLIVIDTREGKHHVYTEDGLSGYIETDKVSNVTEETVVKSDGWMNTEKYDYISMDGKVCLGWHQMEYEEGNSSLTSVIKATEGLNVISPTWFKLVDGLGEISSLASSDYVNKAHNNGLQVWGLISDFNKDEDGNYYVNQVVTRTSSRRKLIENIINEATKCGMDGINVDFEMVRKTAAEGYIQFMREFAISCENVGLVLSVDMYVPSESNKYYDRESVGKVVDYFIIMGYDEHWAGGANAGSVASLPFVTDGIKDTLEEVDASKIINAIPFYTRVWYEDPVELAPEDAIIIEDPVNGDYALSSKAVGMGVAEMYLAENGATSRWLDDLGQNYGEFYTNEGRLGRVWLEDEQSLRAKLNVMKENNLAGVACWKLGLESEAAWEVIGEFLK